MGWFTSSKKFDVNSYSTSLSRGGQVEFPMERDGMKGHLLGLTILLSNCRHLLVFTGKLHSLGSNHHMLGLLKGWSMSFGDHNRCIHWKAAFTGFKSPYVGFTEVAFCTQLYIPQC